MLALIHLNLDRKKLPSRGRTFGQHHCNSSPTSLLAIPTHDGVGVLHADLKPENIMVEPDAAHPSPHLNAFPSIKIIDFSNAMRLEVA